MKVTGIIAEYNPFHNGHLYQIEQIKKETDTDYIIVILSGDFVQRGTPAIVDKYTRTRMALACGADLVIELPTLFATASAEYFAAAGITALDKLGIVDRVCFGAECPDVKLLSYLADILLHEPEVYQHELNRMLKEGKPFPYARMQALSVYLSRNGNTPFEPEDILTALTSPNNILGIEYIKELKRRNSKIQPYIIHRIGNGYHDHEISPLASATALRQLLLPFTNSCVEDSAFSAHFTDRTKPSFDSVYEKLLSAMPQEAASCLLNYCQEFPLLNEDAFSSILKYKLLLEPSASYEHYADVTVSLSNRLIKYLDEFHTFSGYCEQLKSREVTHTRISRILTHILLNITQTDYTLGRESDYIPYLRILGFRKSATQLLGCIKEHSTLPMITKMADANKLLSGIYPAPAFAHRMLALDVFAANIYTSVLTDISGKLPPNEYTQGIILH